MLSIVLDGCEKVLQVITTTIVFNLRKIARVFHWGQRNTAQKTLKVKKLRAIENTHSLTRHKLNTHSFSRENNFSNVPSAILLIRFPLRSLTKEQHQNKLNHVHACRLYCSSCKEMKSCLLVSLKALFSGLTNTLLLFDTNIHWKNYRLLIGLKRLHSHVTRVQTCNTSENCKQCPRFQNFVCPALLWFFFHVNYYQAITWVLLQFGVISTWAFFKCPGSYNFVVFEKLTRAC